MTRKLANINTAGPQDKEGGIKRSSGVFKLLHWHILPTLIVGISAYSCSLHQWEVIFLPFPCKSDYVWLPVSGCGHACVCPCSELNKMWRWVSGEPVLEWAGLMCSQQTASDPSSACLNWAPGFIQYRPAVLCPLQVSAAQEATAERSP